MPLSEKVPSSQEGLAGTRLRVDDVSMRRPQGTSCERLQHCGPSPYYHVGLCAALAAHFLLLGAVDGQQCDSNVYWNSSESMNWTDAFALCSSLNGSLPVIQSSCQNDLVANVSGGARTWTAGTRLLPYSSSSSQFQWVTNLSAGSGPVFFNGTTNNTGRCTSYCKCTSGQPDNFQLVEGCVVANFGSTENFWNDFSCNQYRLVVCMFRSAQEVPTRRVCPSRSPCRLVVPLVPQDR